LKKEQDPEPVEPRIEVLSSSKSDWTGNVTPELSNKKIDQEMADEYGWTPQQAKESGLYL
jgi:hypothetical protein